MTSENKIIDAELANLGFTQPEQEQAVPPAPAPSKPNKRVIKKSPDLFDMPDIPDFLVRDKKPDTRTTEWKPTPVVQTTHCEALQSKLTDIRLRVEQNSGSPDAVIDTADLNELTEALSRNMGDMMEHAGFIHISGDAALRLKEYIRMYLLTNCKVYNGSMYRYPVEKGAK